MSGTAAQVEWFIARDGARHGPISDVEMRKFVELGHLKPTDLVWCPQFSEWQLASVVFPPAIAATAPPVAPPPPPAGLQTQPQHGKPVQAASDAASPRVNPGPGQEGLTAAARQPRAPTQPPAGTAYGHAPSPQGSEQPAFRGGGDGSDDAAWAHAMRNVLQQSGPVAGTAQPQSAQTHPGGNQAGYHSGIQARMQAEGGPAFGSPQAPTYQPHGDSRAGVRFDETAAPAPAFQSPRPHTHAADPGFGAPHGSAGFGEDLGHAQPGRGQGDAAGYDDEGYEPPRRKRGGRLAMIAAVLLIIGGLGWVGWQNRSMIAGASAIGSAITTTVSTVSSTVSSGPPADALRLSPYDAPGTTAEAIDGSLQKTAIWRVLKRDFPEWYGERLTDVARMREEKRDEKVISRFLADVIITLRRRHAISALQSSPEHLKGMARRFGENLKQLSSRDGATCFQFITFGEANPEALELSRTPAFAEPLQRQMIAIFEAIRNAKGNATVHAATRRSDYDLLTKDLMARGWTATDLATFSDPQKLTASPPEKVCTLVQEWFQTHLALADGDLQSRLLAESLKPLVGG